MKLTGVCGTMSAAHYSRDGKLHGHTWSVVVWLDWTGADAEALKAKLTAVLSEFDHGVLPDALAWAEDIAEYVGERMAAREVEISRLEGFKARWVR